MVNGKGDTALAYNTAQALNATRMRILVEWSRVSDADDPTPSLDPDYDWGPIDRAIDTAAAHGMRTQVALAGPAPTRRGTARSRSRSGAPTRRATPISPVLPPSTSRAASTATRIWNEPNYPSWLEPQSQSPQLYRALYEAGDNAIKSVDPSAQVLIGETVPYGGKVVIKTKGKNGKTVSRGKRLGLATAPLKWLRAVACVNARYKRINGCTPLHADGYAHHPYDLEFGGDATPPNTKKFPGADNAPIETLETCARRWTSSPAPAPCRRRRAGRWTST